MRDRHTRVLLIAVTLFSLGATAAGCSAADGLDADEVYDGDDPEGSSSEAITGPRWQPPATRQVGSYEGAGAWNGGRGCSGSLRPGSRALGDRIKAQFALRQVDGYACRRNTASTSQLSMHGTGRALDIFSTGTKGTQVANYLVSNANQLGIQMVIWNRTIWTVTSGGGSSRAYGGPNPHTDHVHAELTSAASLRASAAPAPSPEDEDSAPPDQDVGGQACVSDGACNPGSDGSGLICQGGRCVPGCRSDAHCPGATRCRSGQCS